MTQSAKERASNLGGPRRNKDAIGLARLITLGQKPDDTFFERQSKAIITSFLIFFSVFAFIFILDPGRPPIVHMMDAAVITGSVFVLIVLYFTKSLRFAFNTVASVGLILIFLFYLMIGNRGADLMLPIIFPLLSVVIGGPRRSQKWIIILVAMMLFVLWLDPRLPQTTHSFFETEFNPTGSLFYSPIKQPLQHDNVYLAIIVSLIIYGMVYAAYAQMIHSRKIVKSQRIELVKSFEKSEKLLLNILPASVADRLRDDPKTTIADDLEDVVILFADIVDFTKTSANLPASEVVALLNKVFSAFDELVANAGMEKIKTTGDAYMVAAGIAESSAADLHKMADLSLDMLKMVDVLNADARPSVAVRIGLHSGLATAGVVGTLKFYYDIWGDTVNLAARLQGVANPNTICVSESVYEKLKDQYTFETLAKTELKGKGEVQTFKLLGNQPE